MAYKTPLEMFYHWESTTPDKIYLSQPIQDQWHTWTWREAGQEARRMAAYLQSLHLPAGTPIGLVSKNCAHWIITDLAIMMAGHVSVPLYPNLTADTVHQILEHAATPVLFVGKLDDWPSMEPGVPDGIIRISFPFYTHDGYLQWHDILNDQRPLEENVVRLPDELMTIIYTSGTTGVAKGVMHSFANVSFAGTEAVAYMDMSDQSVFFSYLPMAHVGERFVVETAGLYCGGTVYFAESIEKFAGNLRHVQPTIFLGIHRMWKKFQEGVFMKMPEQKLKRLLQVPIVSWYVKRKIRHALGFSRLQRIFTAATPTPPELLEWYKSIGVNILEGYSMTENFGYSHANPPDRIRIGYVGTPLPKCEVKLGEHNEVLVKNAAVMQGYYKEPEMTREAFTDDGFLRTGDEGHIDDQGYLRITGRTKDIFKTAKGKYVVPTPIEMKVAASSNVEFCCVVGVGLPQPVALVTLSVHGHLVPMDELSRQFETLRQEINATLDPHEQLEKIILLKDTWTVDNQLLTPTFKLRRKDIERRYQVDAEAWYHQPGGIIFQA
jgi:long-chain acyl-CoA synthetase